MKHQTARLSDPTMRFFTPDLYQRFNSRDEDEADRADQEWEEAIQAYRRNLSEFKEPVPSGVRNLAELCLHDAEVLSRVEDIQVTPAFVGTLTQAPIPAWSAVAIFSVKQDRKIVSLIYALWDMVRVSAPPKDWHFAKTDEHWLYDEVEQVAERQQLFLHRVLLSTGKVVVVPFVSVVVHLLDLPISGAKRKSKKSA